MKSQKNFFGQYSPNLKHKLFGVHPVVKKAPEPSNIIWENYSVHSRTSKLRAFKTYAVMTLLYSAVFFVFWKLYAYRTDYSQNYSVKIDCMEVS